MKARQSSPPKINGKKSSSSKIKVRIRRAQIPTIKKIMNKLLARENNGVGSTSVCSTLLNYLSACNISPPSGAEAAADFCSLLRRPFCNLFSLLEDPRMMEVVGTTGTSRGVEAGVTEELVSRKKNPLVGSSKRTSRHSCPEKWKDV